MRSMICFSTPNITTSTLFLGKHMVTYVYLIFLKETKHIKELQKHCSAHRHWLKGFIKWLTENIWKVGETGVFKVSKAKNKQNGTLNSKCALWYFSSPDLVSSGWNPWPRVQIWPGALWCMIFLFVREIARRKSVNVTLLFVFLSENELHSKYECRKVEITQIERWLVYLQIIICA